MHARIKLQIKPSRLRLPAHRQANLVMSRNRHRPTSAVPVFVKVITRHMPSFFIPQIPDKAIQACFRLYLLLGFFVIRIRRLLQCVVFRARVFADHLPRSIQNLQLGLRLTFRSILQVVINDGSRRRIVPCQLRRMPLPTRPRLNPKRRGGLIQERGFLRDILAVLPQGRQIIQNPEGPPVCRHHQIVIFDQQIVHRHSRQIQLKETPFRSIIE